MRMRDFLQGQILHTVQLVGVSMYSKYTESNLDVIKELCDDLEGFFESFILDRVWSADEDRVTVCFTAEKIKSFPKLPEKRILA